VLPTIASRCQAVGFGPLPQALVREWLLGQGCAPELAEQLSYLAGGSLWRAGRLLEPGLPEERTRLLSALAGLAHGSASQVMELGQEVAASPHRDELLEVMRSYWRDALVLAAAGREDCLVNRDFLAQLGLAAEAGAAELARRAASVARAQARIEANCDARLALEVLLFELAHIGASHA